MAMKQTYWFSVRVNWDKLIAMEERNESFKAQIFVEATLVHPPSQEVLEDDKARILKAFQRLTVENSLDKPCDDDDAKKKKEFEDTVKDGTFKFTYLLHGEFCKELNLRNFPLDQQALDVMLRVGWSLSHA